MAENEKPKTQITQADQNRLLQQAALLALAPQLAEHNKFTNLSSWTQKRCGLSADNARVGVSTQTITGVTGANSYGERRLSVYKLKDISQDIASIDIINCFREEKLKLEMPGDPFPTEQELMAFTEYLTPLHISMLTPYATVFKARAIGGLTKETCDYKLHMNEPNFYAEGNEQIKFKFKDSTDLAERKLEAFFRGERETLGGYGIKKISMKQLTSPQSGFSYTSYDVQASFYFQSYEEFVRTRYYDKSGNPYNLANVLIGFEKEIKNANGEPMTYVSVIEIGYSIERPVIDAFFADIPGVDVNRIPRILDMLKINVALQPYNYTINPNEDGSIEVVIQYRGWNESMLQKPAMADLLSFPEYMANMAKGEWSIEKRKQVAKDIEIHRYTNLMNIMFKDRAVLFAIIEDKFLRDFQGTIDSFVKGSQASATLIDDIQKRKEKATSGIGEMVLSGAEALVGGINMSVPKVPVFSFDGDFDPAAVFNEFTTETISDAANRKGAQKREGEAKQAQIKKADDDRLDTGGKAQHWGIDMPGESRKVPFFFFSELITAATKKYLDNMRQHMPGFRFTADVDFGEIRIINPLQPLTNGSQPNFIHLNLGDLPIAYDLFTVWWNRQVVQASLDQYMYLEFLQDVGSNLLMNILNEPEFFDWKGIYTRLGIAASEAQNFRINMYPSVFFYEKNGQKYVHFYLYVYTDDTNEKYLQKKRTNSKPTDNERGIWWFTIGTDRGMLKRVKFEKSNNPTLRSSLASKAYQAADEKKEFDIERRMSQLREIYNCSLTTLGNGWLCPGKLICVQPSVLGVGNVVDPKNDYLNYIGIGGYYYITSTEISFSPGGLETNVAGIWSGRPEDRTKTGDGAVDYSAQIRATGQLAKEQNKLMKQVFPSSKTPWERNAEQRKMDRLKDEEVRQKMDTIGRGQPVQ
jgi:hypothetical protein